MAGHAIIPNKIELIEKDGFAIGFKMHPAIGSVFDCYFSDLVLRFSKPTDDFRDISETAPMESTRIAIHAGRSLRGTVMLLPIESAHEDVNRTLGDKDRGLTRNEGLFASCVDLSLRRIFEGTNSKKEAHSIAAGFAEQEIVKKPIISEPPAIREFADSIENNSISKHGISKTLMLFVHLVADAVEGHIQSPEQFRMKALQRMKDYAQKKHYSAGDIRLLGKIGEAAFTVCEGGLVNLALKDKGLIPEAYLREIELELTGKQTDLPITLGTNGSCRGIT